MWRISQRNLLQSFIGSLQLTNHLNCMAWPPELAHCAPPINLEGLIFSVNRNFGSGRTPPLRDEINPKKFQSFSVNRNFGLGQTPPSPFWINSEIKKYFFMSKKKYFEKLKKKTEYLMKKQSIWWQKSVFYDKNPLGIGETPPPFGKKNPTKNSVFSDKEILDWERPPPHFQKK